MQVWIKRIYGQYKLIKTACYLDRQIKEALWHEEWERMRDLLDAGGIVLDAKDSL